MRALLVVLSVSAASPAIAQDYRFPIELPGAGSTQPYVTAYRDHDGGGGLQDWNCGTNTYNGHRGTDLGIGGFPVMDNGSRWVVAAAPGTVTYVVDGCFDRCTSGSCGCGGGFGNYVKVTHADGKSTYYGHMMNGSIQVGLNDTVTCGQRLGKVASSGNSTGPHLHFEPRYSSNTSDDPFAGSCGGPISFWVDQRAYNALPGTQCDGENPPPPPPPPPSDGTIKGVVWDRSVTEGPNDDGNVRVPGTTVTIEGGESAAAREPDGFWSFTLEAGTYRLTATAPGYDPESKEVTVVVGEEVWASFGLTQEEQMPPEVDDATLVEMSMPEVVTALPNETFERFWTLRNTGSTTWSSDYSVQFMSGDRLEGPEVLAISGDQLPGEEYLVAVTLVAPSTTGAYRGEWSLVREGVGPFGPTLVAEVQVEESVDIEPEDPDAGVDPGMKEPPDDMTPPEDMAPPDDMVNPVDEPVSGGCRCAGAPAGPAGLLLLLGVFVLLRARVARADGLDP